MFSLFLYVKQDVLYFFSLSLSIYYYNAPLSIVDGRQFSCIPQNGARAPRPRLSRVSSHLRLRYRPSHPLFGVCVPVSLTRRIPFRCIHHISVYGCRPPASPASPRAQHCNRHRPRHPTTRFCRPSHRSRSPYKNAVTTSMA